MRSSGKSAIVYTDGSTAGGRIAKRKPNSGSSIVVTDDRNSEVWCGGIVVRTDGNNFIAELAASVVVCQACPPEFPLTLRIDSKAAIGALLKGVVSERKRVRAAGRAWLSFGRPALIAKRDHIFIEHVRSHQGVDSPEQVGNDRADVIAKSFLNKGSKLPPALYLTHMCHKGNY